MKDNFYHLFLAAYRDFSRNKVRTFLTSLGIMIGVMSVVLLIALGIGLRNYIEDQFENLGANLILVMPGSGFGGSGGGGFGGAGLVGGASFDERDVSSLQRIREIDYVVPVFMKSSSIQSETETKVGYIMGCNEQMFDVLNVKIFRGQLWDKSDLQAGNKVVVLGNAIADGLYDDPAQAVGKSIRVDKQRFRVVGVIEKTGDNEQDNGLFVPYKTTFGTLNPTKTFWSIYLGVKSDELVSVAKTKAEETLLKRYKKDDFSVTEQSEFLSTLNSIFSIINTVLIAIGSISLVVGGIGIMNIMYASVTERTKEIGIRRAVGATKADIMRLFLVEAVTLSVFGGVLGLVVAEILVLIARFFFPAAIDLMAVVLAFGVSSVIGIFFGVFPARRAANLSPIEAIRYE